MSSITTTSQSPSDVYCHDHDQSREDMNEAWPEINANPTSPPLVPSESPIIESPVLKQMNWKFANLSAREISEASYKKRELRRREKKELERLETNTQTKTGKGLTPSPYGLNRAERRASGFTYENGKCMPKSNVLTTGKPIQDQSPAQIKIPTLAFDELYDFGSTSDLEESDRTTSTLGEDGKLMDTTWLPPVEPLQWTLPGPPLPCVPMGPAPWEMFALPHLLPPLALLHNFPPSPWDQSTPCSFIPPLPPIDPLWNLQSVPRRPDLPME